MSDSSSRTPEDRPGEQTVEIVPTSNEWDAPFAFYSDEDGTSHLRRDLVEPYGFDWTHRTLLPHAVVYVDDEMSAFDRKRQPSGESL